MTRTAYAALTFAVAAVVSGCGLLGGTVLTDGDLSGSVTTESRDATDFTMVDLRGSGTVDVTLGEEFSVSVTTDTALLEHLTTDVSGSTLVLDQDFTFMGTVPDVHYDVTMPSTRNLEVSGSGIITAEGIDNDTVTLAVTGSGDVIAAGRAVNVEAEVTGSGSVDASALAVSRGTVTITGSGEAIMDISSELTVEVIGSGTVTATGTAEIVEIDISGSGDVQGRRMTANEAQIVISGAGDVELGVRDVLDVRITGSGDVIYYGEPSVDVENQGIGTVTAGT